MAKRMKRNRFDFNDFLDQMRMMKKMGSMSDLLGMIPGMGAEAQESCPSTTAR